VARVAGERGDAGARAHGARPWRVVGLRVDCARLLGCGEHWAFLLLFSIFYLILFSFEFKFKYKFVDYENTQPKQTDIQHRNRCSS
jgi:cytochrome bd-type quinol oxidase subunit 1